MPIVGTTFKNKKNLSSNINIMNISALVDNEELDRLKYRADDQGMVITEYISMLVEQALSDEDED